MTIEDVFNTLRAHSLITLREPTPPPGSAPASPAKSATSKRRHGGIARNNLSRKSNKADLYALTTIPTHYSIQWDRDAIKEYVDKIEAKGLAKLRHEKLRWSPYLISRTRKSDGLEPIPEPSMFSGTQLEPMEYREVEAMDSKGRQTPKGNSKGRNGRKSQMRGPSATPSAGQLSHIDWIPEDLDEDDDDFRDDDSTSPEMRRPTRNSGRTIHTRRSRTTEADEEDSDEEGGDASMETPIVPRRTRSGVARRGDDSNSEWGEEQQQQPVRTRSRSHATRSTKLGGVSSRSLSEAPELDSPVIPPAPFPSPVKKNHKRVIETPSDSGEEDGDYEETPSAPVVVEDHETVGDADVEETQRIEKQGYFGADTAMAGMHIPFTNGKVNGIFHPSPETTAVSPATQVAQGEFSGDSEAKVERWLDVRSSEKVNGITNGVEHVNAANTVPHSMDATTIEYHDLPLNWKSNHVEIVPRVDEMEMCDEDAEGEDIDAEGEDDPYDAFI